MSDSLSPHQPVLLKQVLDHLSWGDSSARVADLTCGYAGHLGALLESNPVPASVLAMDQDAYALEFSKSKLEKYPSVQFVQDNFRNIKNYAEEGFDRVLVDLGVSSYQLDMAERGFSFRRNGPLDMRMNPSTGQSAANWLNSAREKEMIEVFRDYGEERRAPVFARKIASARKEKALETTKDLVEAMGFHMEWKTKRGAIHPCTRVFQAIRIHINEELQVLDEFLRILPEILRPEARVGIISFHSLEDRAVKWGLRGRLKAVNKKVIIADEAEAQDNPRARSAKLRVFEA